MPKTSVENNFQKQVKANAEKELNNLQEQAGLILRDKIANFDYILMLVRLVSRLVKKTESDKAETKTADKIVKLEAIDEDYVPSTPAPASDIRVDDDKAVDKEYLTLVLNKIFLAVIRKPLFFMMLNHPANWNHLSVNWAVSR